jgi:hypothetical protein
MSSISASSGGVAMVGDSGGLRTIHGHESRD